KAQLHAEQRSGGTVAAARALPGQTGHAIGRTMASVNPGQMVARKRAPCLFSDSTAHLFARHGRGASQSCGYRIAEDPTASPQQHGYTIIIITEYIMHMSLKKTLISFAMGCSVLASGTAWSADYPSKAIRLIVPYSAGGGADNAARIIAKALGDTLKQPIVIENKAGASGSIGATQVARAPADGYTLLYDASSF